jgi:hypothetical protein
MNPFRVVVSPSVFDVVMKFLKKQVRNGIYRGNRQNRIKEVLNFLENGNPNEDIQAKYSLNHVKFYAPNSSNASVVSLLCIDAEIRNILYRNDPEMQKKVLKSLRKESGKNVLTNAIKRAKKVLCFDVKVVPVIDNTTRFRVVVPTAQVERIIANSKHKRILLENREVEIETYVAEVREQNASIDKFADEAGFVGSVRTLRPKTFCDELDMWCFRAQILNILGNYGDQGTRIKKLEELLQECKNDPNTLILTYATEEVRVCNMFRVIGTERQLQRLLQDLKVPSFQESYILNRKGDIVDFIRLLRGEHTILRRDFNFQRGYAESFSMWNAQLCVRAELLNDLSRCSKEEEKINKLNALLKECNTLKFGTFECRVFACGRIEEVFHVEAPAELITVE